MNLTLRRWQQRLHDPALTVLLLIEALAIFVMSPLRAVGIIAPPTITATLGLGVIAVVVLLSRSPGLTLVVFASLALNVAGRLMHVANPSAFTDVLSAAGEVMVRGGLTWVVAAAVFAPGQITHYRVQGAVVLYLNVAMIFTALYRLVAELGPGAFTGLPAGPIDAAPLADITYFSFSTMTTSGYGDIVPVHPFARSLANLEAIIGQLYPATLLARIVTLELAHRRRPPPRRHPDRD